MNPSLQIQEQLTEVESLLHRKIDALQVSERLKEAMAYSLFNGGKRMRPMLVLASASAVSEVNELSYAVAASVECMHAYSLIHDDLPAMDDDELRRGMPTNHVQFDEATAILAGDALQALSFQILAEATIGHRKAAELVLILAKCGGADGMVGGQMLDLLAEKREDPISLSELTCIHVNKTGALIGASVLMGAISANAQEQELVALGEYADALGLAFQVQDDILDITSSTETLGKRQGADIQQGKSTFITLMGLSASKEKASELVRIAKSSLDRLCRDTRTLNDIADFCISRVN